MHISPWDLLAKAGGKSGSFSKEKCIHQHCKNGTSTSIMHGTVMLEIIQNMSSYSYL